jgi:hypothetical protein
MQTISVQMSDREYSAFGLSKNIFSFPEIVDLIKKQLARQPLETSDFWKTLSAEHKADIQLGISEIANEETVDYEVLMKNF